MDKYLNQISGYFTHVPAWPIVLLMAVIACAGIYQIFIRRYRTISSSNCRSSIHSILSGLYPEPTNWPKDVGKYLRDRLPAMQEVIEDFRRDIPQESIPAYNKDWENYCKFCNEITDDICAAADLDSSNAVNPKQIFHNLVSNILRHIK